MASGQNTTEIQREQMLTHLQWEVEQPLLHQGVRWSWVQMSLLPKAGYWGAGSLGKLVSKLPAMAAVYMPARHTDRKQAGFQCKSAWQATWASSEIHWHGHLPAEYVGPPGRISLCWNGTNFCSVGMTARGHLVDSSNLVTGAASTRKADKKRRRLATVERSAVWLCECWCRPILFTHL